MADFNSYRDIPITDVNGMVVGRMTLRTVACENWADSPDHFEIVPNVLVKNNETKEAEILSLMFKTMQSVPKNQRGETVPKLMPYTNAREDLAQIIAQETAGVTGAIPEQDDYDLASVFINIINSDEYRDNLVSTYKQFRLNQG